MRTRRAVWFIGFFMLGAVLLSNPGSYGQAAPTRQTSPSSAGHKVVAPPGLLRAGDAGIELLQDYGTFSLYRIAPAALDALPDEVRDRLQPADEMDRILIDTQPFNTQTEALDLPQNLATGESSGTMLELVQFVGPIKAEWLESVRAAGGRPIHYVANNAYLVWVDANGRSRLDRLAGQGDFIQYRAPFQPYFKLGKSIQARVIELKDPDELVTVAVQMLRHAGQTASEAVIAGLSRSGAPSWTPVLDFQTTVILLRAADLLGVAALPDVNWVGERLPRQRFDEVQGQILAGSLDNARQGPSGTGYLAWLAGHGFSQDPSDYPILDITDDGVGDGTLDSGDPTLHLGGLESGPSRLAYLQNCTIAADGGGPDGHGHINASIAGGYDTRSGFPYQDAAGFNLGLGINPFGRLASTRIFTSIYDVSGCGGTDTGVIQASYRAGGRISSNSWGCGDCAPTYDDSSQAYDAGVRDADPAQPGNQPLTILFAAGNNGRFGDATIGTPGNAKNVITVGATESYRPTWTDGCSVGPTGADNAMEVSNFSSRGPAPGGRVKPDVVAPGTHIQGAASTHPAYNGSAICDAYQPGGQTLFAASSGTSHSTPAVAGMISLYTYWLEHQYGLASPSPAMLKAYLVAHTAYLGGAGTLPSNSQGYGLPDMEAAFAPIQRFLLDQTVVFEDSGEQWSFNGAVADPTQPVRIVLAYTDQAGLVGASPQVNDLTLQVSVGSVAYWGNQFLQAWSVPGGSPDTSNNVEAVFLPAGIEGALDIHVTAFNIAGDGLPGSGDTTDQDFALVCTNCIAVERQDVCAPQSAVFNLSIPPVPGVSGPVMLSARGLPDGATASFNPNPVTLPAATQLTITPAANSLPGSYSLEVYAMASGEVRVATLELNLFDGPPGAPSLIAPEFAAVDQAVTPEFAWSSTGPGSAYTIEISTGPEFTQLSLFDAGLDRAAYTPFSQLEHGHLYYWRVQAGNACGVGDFSAQSVLVTAPDVGDCPLGQAPLPLMVEDFEDYASGWTHGGSGDTWASTTTRRWGGLQAIWALDPATISDQWLISPPFALPVDKNPLTLHFWNYQELEHRTDTSCYDGALLEIQTAGSEDWTQVPGDALLSDPYDGPIRTSNNPLGGRQAWCGDPQDWVESIVALDAYVGQNLQMRFRLGSDNSKEREGWYIDDVAVQGCSSSGSLAVLGPESTIQALSGETTTHHFWLRNLGVEETYALSIAAGRWPAALGIPALQTLGPGEVLDIPVKVSVPVVTLADGEVLDTFLLTALPARLPQGVLTVQGNTVASVQSSARLSPDQFGFAPPGGQIIYVFSVSNTGNLEDTFSLAARGKWSATLAAPKSILLAPGESVAVSLIVQLPVSAVPGDRDTATLRVISSRNAKVYEAHATTIAGDYQLLFPFIGRR